MAVSFHDDCTDRDFRRDLSPDQLERLERLEQQAAPLEPQINLPSRGRGVIRRLPCAAQPPTALAASVEPLTPPNRNDATDPATRHDDTITRED